MNASPRRPSASVCHKTQTQIHAHLPPATQRREILSSKLQATKTCQRRVPATRKPRISFPLDNRSDLICLQICEEKKIKTKIRSSCDEWKKCTTLIYLQRFNNLLVTLYIVHMGFKFSLFILYTDLYLCVLLEIFVFFIYRRGVFFSLFIDFYLWRVI